MYAASLKDEFSISELVLDPGQHLPEDIMELIKQARRHVDVFYGSCITMQDASTRIAKYYQGKRRMKY
jgi:hypothetical protein